MSTPPENESPFKRDEPVSRSRKWMLLAFLCLVLSLANQVAGYVRQPVFTLDDLWRSLLAVTLYGMLLVFLWRAARMSGHCRKHRSFDMMATAVRAQRPFWIMLTVTGAIGSIYLVVLSMQMQDSVAFVQRWLKDNRPAAAKRP